MEPITYVTNKVESNFQKPFTNVPNLYNNNNNNNNNIAFFPKQVGVG